MQPVFRLDCPDLHSQPALPGYSPFDVMATVPRTDKSKRAKICFQCRNRKVFPMGGTWGRPCRSLFSLPLLTSTNTRSAVMARSVAVRTARDSNSRALLAKTLPTPLNSLLIRHSLAVVPSKPASLVAIRSRDALARHHASDVEAIGSSASTLRTVDVLVAVRAQPPARPPSLNTLYRTLRVS